MADFDTQQSEQYGHRRMDFDVPEANGGFVILPQSPADGSPWVWYAPTFVAGDLRLPKPLHEWYLRPLLEAGFAVGGVDVGESWGSPAGRVGYTEFYQLVVREFALAQKACLMPQSRGGLMHYNWAAEHPQCVQCVGAIYPVCDVTRPIRVETISQAYGLTPEQILAQLDRHNPLDRLKPLAEAGVPVLHVHGDQDEPVPLESNSTEFQRRYTRLGGRMKLIVIEGKGHEEVPEYFQRLELLEFFLTQGRTVTDI